MKLCVNVTLKPAVLDPQGEAVVKTLHHLGFTNVEQVRIGKRLEIEYKGIDEEQAKNDLKEMAKKLLANPVIEDFRIEKIERSPR